MLPFHSTKSSRTKLNITKNEDVFCPQKIGTTSQLDVATLFVFIRIKDRDNDNFHIMLINVFDSSTDR